MQEKSKILRRIGQNAPVEARFARRKRNVSLYIRRILPTPYPTIIRP